MKKILLALPALAGWTNPGTASAIPPPVEDVAADCAAPVYASDQLICDDPELRAIDAAYRAALDPPLPLATNALWEDNGAWLRRRSLCARLATQRVCLLAAYRERMAQFAAARAAESVTAPLACTGRWAGRALRWTPPATGAPLVVREAGSVAGIASVNAQDGGWKSNLRYRVRGKRVDFQILDGASIRCRASG